MIKYAVTYLRIIRKDASFRRSLVGNLIYLLGIVLRKVLMRKYPKVIIINLTEHMGDVVATEPVAKHVRDQNPAAFIIWCVNEKFVELVKYNRHVNKVITVTCIAEWILLKKAGGRGFKIYDLHLDGRSCSKYKLTNKNKSKTGITIFNYLQHGNLLEVFSRSAGLKLEGNPTPEFHFSPDKNDAVIFPFKYIVVHTLANDAERNWSDDQWNILLRKMLETYPEIHVVEIGLRSILSSASPRFHNVCSKYNLQQIAHIINRADLFIGVESGFGHFANALGTNSVIMIGHYQHYRNYQVYSGRFAKGTDVTLHYYPGKLHEMDVENIWPVVETQLKGNQMPACTA